MTKVIRDTRKEMKFNYETRSLLFPRDLLHDGLTKFKYFLQMAFLSFFDYELTD